ncbi:hypothetical protein DL765_008076 [Monosporascus sp. GIB2]|nr:hypothetical protein DL765_008076 [Monosporascus sp. GIB2]
MAPRNEKVNGIDMKIIMARAEKRLRRMERRDEATLEQRELQWSAQLTAASSSFRARHRSSATGQSARDRGSRPPRAMAVPMGPYPLDAVLNPNVPDRKEQDHEKTNKDEDVPMADNGYQGKREKYDREDEFVRKPENSKGDADYQQPAQKDKNEEGKDAKSEDGPRTAALLEELRHLKSDDLEFKLALVRRVLQER